MSYRIVLVIDSNVTEPEILGLTQTPAFVVERTHRSYSRSGSWLKVCHLKR
jgi:hypothetical protein